MVARSIFIPLFFVLVSCGSGRAPSDQVSKTSVRLLSSVSPSHKVVVSSGGNIEISYKSIGDTDSAKVWVADSMIAVLPAGTVSVIYSVPQTIQGTVVYKVEAFRDADRHNLIGRFTVVPDLIPEECSVQVVKSYPHAPDAYTQGLLFYDGKLYESTGEYGNSSLRLVEIETGKVLKKYNLDDEFFAEGLVMFSNKLYQLTWLEQKGFVYDPDDFGIIGEFAYQGEGWGLATDGSKIYMSSGNSLITVHEPERFAKEKTIEILDNSGPVDMLNEMEWIEGRIWANIYMTDRIAIIDPSDGTVEAYVDCSSLHGMIGNGRDADVLNGIAYDPVAKKIYVTGKNWDTLFEIKLIKK